MLLIKKKLIISNLNYFFFQKMEDKVIGGRLQQLELVSSESFYNENPE